MKARGVTITSLGNAGVLIASPVAALAIDPFDWSLPELQADARHIDLVLVTHDHWDHFDRKRVGELAAAHGATVCGPRSITQKLERKLEPGLLVQAEPESPSGNPRRSPPLRVAVRGVAVTAFRSHHSRDHTSYLLELAGVRLFHDGDNQDTTLYDTALLAGLDCLMLCPWQGSAWVPFIRAIRPRSWLLVHLEEAELVEHAGGRFLPPLCDEVPMEALALRPGQGLEIGGAP
jgi:L-ascorbate metabolism protein UlaG (beta-lactamase superfamily)